MDKTAKQNETTPTKTGGSRSPILFWLLAAFALTLLLAGAFAERLAKQQNIAPADGIMLASTVAIALILLGVIVASRKKSLVIGEGEITVFDLNLDDFQTGDESQIHPKSIGTLAQSIRQTANEVSIITERLAEAHEGGHLTERSPDSTLRAIVDSQADTLAQLDLTTNEAFRLGEETAILNELLAASVSMANLHANHGSDHAMALESITVISRQVLNKAGEAATLNRLLERDRDTLSLNSQETLASLKEILGIVDTTLLEFRDGARELDETQATLTRPFVPAPANSSLPVAATLEDLKNKETKNAIKGLTDHLAKVAESIQLTRMNQRLKPEHLFGAHDAGLDEAENLIRETKDAAAIVERILNREAEVTRRVISDISIELADVKSGREELGARTKKLSILAGNLGQALGQIRLGMLSEAGRMESALARSIDKGSSSHQQLTQNLIQAASQMAHGSNRLAIEGQRLHIDGKQLLAKMEDLRVISAAGRGHVQRLQQATGATSSKVDAVVKLAHALVRREDSATRKSTANTARFAIQDKVALIDRFALRVMEMENKVKRMRGPSPAIDRSELAKLPEYEFPVQ